MTQCCMYIRLIVLQHRRALRNISNQTRLCHTFRPLWRTLVSHLDARFVSSLHSSTAVSRSSRIYQSRFSTRTFSLKRPEILTIVLHTLYFTTNVKSLHQYTRSSNLVLTQPCQILAPLLQTLVSHIDTHTEQLRSCPLFSHVLTNNTRLSSPQRHSPVKTNAISTALHTSSPTANFRSLYQHTFSKNSNQTQLCYSLHPLLQTQVHHTDARSVSTSSSHVARTRFNRLYQT